MNNFKLKTKLMLGFAFPIVALVIISSVVYSSLNSMVVSNGWVNHTHEVIEEGELILASMVDMETGMRGFLVAGKDEFLEPYNGGQKSFKDIVSKLKNTVNDNPTQVARLEQIETLETQWQKDAAKPQIELRRRVNRGSATMDDMVAMIQKGQGKASMDAIRAKIGDFIGEEKSLIKVRNEEARNIASWTTTVTIIGTLVAIFFVSIVSFFLIRGIHKQIGGEPEVMADISSRIAKGDLTVEMSSTGHETGIYAAMATMVKNLRSTVEQVLHSSQLIDGASKELADGNNNLSERTEEQASSLEETASSMEEMTSTVKQNAISAQQANQLAEAARKNAEQGGQVVNRAIEAMGEITQASTQIADIITTIDSIAFQTNLLALNAAVEAARAGEQGRGFAVVASEVRTLAQRSAEAAKEIKGLIEDSVTKVNNGTELVDQSGKTLVDIIDGINKVADIVTEINAASTEQASGIEQVNGAVTSMDGMTQQNAALVEEAAATSRSMQDQAVTLLELMGFFNLGQGMSGSSAAKQRSVTQGNTMKTVSSSKAATNRDQAQNLKTGTDSSSWENF